MSRIRKEIFLVAILLLYLAVQSKAQWANIGPGTQSLSSISFFNSNYGWACGSAGSLYKSIDGGTTWQYQPNFATPGLLNRLRSVAIPTLSTVSLIYETPLNPQPTATYTSSNTGMVFAAQEYGTFNRLVYHPNVALSLLVGDNGTARVAFFRNAPWQNTPSGTQAHLRDGDCPTEQVCYVVGDGGVIRRSNATLNGFIGQNSTTSNRLNGVSFADASFGCVVGQSGTVLRTTNGGTTWTRIAVPTIVNLNDVWLVDANIGFAVGELGTILLTTNGGLTWQVEPTNTFETLYSLTATADGANIWAAGDGGTVLKRGPVVLTTSSPAFGQPWQAYPNPFTSAITLDLSLIKAQHLEVSIRDAAGRQVHCEDVTGLSGQQGCSLALPAAMAPGIYLVQLTGDNKVTETRRLVKLP